MRIINLDEYATIEFWPGRRLYCTKADDIPSIYSLPRSTMTGLRGKTTEQLHFGSIGRSTVMVTGSAKTGRVAALAAAIVEAEAPDGRVGL